MWQCVVVVWRVGAAAERAKEDRRGPHVGGMPLPRENLSRQHLAAQSGIQQPPTIVLHARLRFKHLQLLWVYSVITLAYHLHIYVTILGCIGLD